MSDVDKEVTDWHEAFESTDPATKINAMARKYVAQDDELAAVKRVADDAMLEANSLRGIVDRQDRQLAAQSREIEALKLQHPTCEWVDGEPPKAYRSEWFIAETIWGDRVVLRALPNEFTYDYKTADDTYIKADKIKRWMQFPDSEFLPYNMPSGPNGYRIVKSREIEALQAANAAMRGCLSKLHFHIKYWGSQEDGVPEEMYDDWKAALELVNSPNPGQPLLDKFSGLTTANELLVAACEKVMDRFGQYINPALALGERDKALASFTVGDRLDEQAWKAVVAALAAAKEARR